MKRARLARDNDSSPEVAAQSQSKSGRTTNKMNEQITLRDQLIRKNQEIFSYARCLWGEYYVWSWKERIFCRYDGNEQIIPLNSVADVEELERYLIIDDSDKDGDSRPNTDAQPTNNSSSAGSLPPTIRKAANKTGSYMGKNDADNLGRYGFQWNVKTSFHQTSK